MDSLNFGHLFRSCFLRIQDRSWCCSWCNRCVDLNFEMHWLNWTSSLVWGCFLQCSSSADFLRIRSVRILDSIVCSTPLVWLFSPAWDAVKLACLKAVFIFPGHRGATTVVLQDECLTPFHLSPTQNILPFTQLVLKLVVCVCRIKIVDSAVIEQQI